jgi:hypothetical protein
MKRFGFFTAVLNAGILNTIGGSAAGIVPEMGSPSHRSGSDFPIMPISIGTCQSADCSPWALGKTIPQSSCIPPCITRLPDCDSWVQSEVGVSSLPPLSERIGPKIKNATDYTDSKSLADDAFELKRPGAEIEEQRQP